MRSSTAKGRERGNCLAGTCDAFSPSPHGERDYRKPRERFARARSHSNWRRRADHRPRSPCILSSRSGRARAPRGRQPAAVACPTTPPKSRLPCALPQGLASQSSLVGRAAVSAAARARSTAASSSPLNASLRSCDWTRARSQTVQAGVVNGSLVTAAAAENLLCAIPGKL